MPNIYCDKCRFPQQKDEKYCTNCGEKYGSGLITLIFGIMLAFGGPSLIFYIDPESISGLNFLRALIYWVLPTIVGTLCLYDSSGKRVMIYFYSGAAVISAGIFLLNFR